MRKTYHKFLLVGLLAIAGAFFAFQFASAADTQLGGNLNATNYGVYNLSGLGVGTSTITSGQICFASGCQSVPYAGGTQQTSAAYLTQGTFGSSVSGSNNQYLFKPTTDTTSALGVQTSGGTSVFDVDTSNQRVGIKTATPTGDLSVEGSVFSRNGLTSNLVLDPQFAHYSTYWGNVSGGVQAIENMGNGQIVNGLDINTTSNVQVINNNVPVDPYKTYRFSIWMKENNTDSTLYFGMHAFNSSNVQVNTYNSAGTGGTNNYFWYGDLASANVWYKKVGYLLPCNTPNGWTNPPDTTTNNFRMDCTTAFVKIRFLNFDAPSYGTGAGTDANFALPSIEEVQSASPAFSLNGSDYIIDPAGNVGIGMTGPSYLLQVNGTAGVNSLTVSPGGSDGGTQTWLYQDSGGNWTTHLVSTALSFDTGGNNARSRRLTIDTSGNVGIGTTTPAVPLSVVGAANFTGTVTAGGFSGPLTGTESAANVSSGSFGANTGGGNYYFPAGVGIGTSTISSLLTITPTSGQGGLYILSPNAGNTHMPYTDGSDYISYASTANVYFRTFNGSSYTTTMTLGNNGNLTATGALTASTLNATGKIIYLNGTDRISDAVSTSYTRIQPQSSTLIIYNGGANNQNLLVYGASGSQGVELSGSTSNPSIYGFGTGVSMSVYGGNVASANLTLDSTSNATKGYVILAPSGGNVGIGTTAPGAKLQVNGDVIIGAYTFDNASLNFTANATQSIIGTTRSDGTQAGSIASNGWGSFSVRGGLAVGYDWPNSSQAGMIIAGNVGIGTTTPAVPLSVVGNANFTGTVTAGGFSGPLSGTITAPNVSAGQFGQSTGGGDYIFPSRLYVGLYGYTNQAGDLAVSRNAASSTGVVYFGNNSSHYLYYDGTNFNFSGGSLNVPTLNTGQGANELYAMNQNVRTTDSPTFAAGTFTSSVTAAGLTSSNGISVTSGDIILSNGKRIRSYNTTGTLDDILNMWTDNNLYLGSSINSSTIFRVAGNSNAATLSNGVFTVNGYSLVVPTAGWSGTNTAYYYMGDTSNGVSAQYGGPSAIFGFWGVNFNNTRYSQTMASITQSASGGSYVTLSVGGGAGKITAATVDPVYTIGGAKYATYGPEMTGINVETTGNVQLTAPPSSHQSSSSYWTYSLDLANAPKGSDLWLWGQTTNLKNVGLSGVSVLLTPSFDGKVWYEKDAKDHTITIFAQPDTKYQIQNTNYEVSYRLSAPRFDSAHWPNTSTDNVEGLNLDKLIK